MIGSMVSERAGVQLVVVMQPSYMYETAVDVMPRPFSCEHDFPTRLS
jgi:hypothetical protein